MDAKTKCEGCPHPVHYGECPGRVIDLSHAPVDRPCWCSVRPQPEKAPEPQPLSTSHTSA